MRSNPLPALCLVIASTCSGSAFGQESPSAVAPIGPEATQSLVSEENAKEPYVFELIKNRVVFEADGKGYRDLVIRADVKSESAVRELGLLVYPFAYSSESLAILYVRVQLFRARPLVSTLWKRTKSLARKEKLQPSATWLFLPTYPVILLVARSYPTR
jgi:hypothetical protein